MMYVTCGTKPSKTHPRPKHRGWWNTARPTLRVQLGGQTIPSRPDVEYVWLHEVIHDTSARMDQVNGTRWQNSAIMEARRAADVSFGLGVCLPYVLLKNLTFTYFQAYTVPQNVRNISHFCI